MSLVQTQPGSTFAIPASEWARLLAQGPTDVVTLPGSTLLVYPDTWTATEVALVLGTPAAPPAPWPPGVPPAG